MRKLEQMVDKVMIPALGKDGAVLSRIIKHWDEIIGDRMASLCQPERLNWAKGQALGAVLTIKVAPAAAVTLQHLQPAIIQKINLFCGYNAVTSLRLLQGSVKRRKLKPDLKIDQQTRDQLHHKIATTIQDDELCQALSNLGAALQAVKHNK